MNSWSSIIRGRILAASIAVVLLAACQHRTPYRASPSGGEPGYSSWPESGAVIHVVFVGAPDAKLTEVRDLALLRAAELTQAAGGREFVVLAEHRSKRSEWIKHNNAPPQSPFVGTSTPGDRSEATRELEARSRSMITSSLATRVEWPVVELKISTQPKSSHRAMDASASYAVDVLLRDIPAKYGLTGIGRN